MKRRTGLLVLVPLLMLIESSCSTFQPSKSSVVELTRPDGRKVYCLEPRPDVVPKGAMVNADIQAAQIGTIAKETIGGGIDVERIRREVSPEITNFDSVLWSTCIQFANGLWSPEQYGVMVGQIIPDINKDMRVAKATPQDQPKESSPPPTATIPEISVSQICGMPLDGLKRKPEVFTPAWVSTLSSLRKQRNMYDLRNLFEVWGRIPVGMTGKDLIQEATFTLRCLEKEGKVTLKKLDTPSTYWGEIFENQAITFRS